MSDLFDRDERMTVLPDDIGRVQSFSRVHESNNYFYGKTLQVSRAMCWLDILRRLIGLIRSSK